MSRNAAQRNRRITAIILLFVIGINALFAGYNFISDPSGKGIGMTLDYLKFSPFSDFLLPGIVLFIFNGVGSISTAIATIFRAQFYAIFILAQGVILTGWILVQIVFVRDFNFLHLFCLFSGAALVWIGSKINLGNRLSAA